ncbi:non-neuronal cytoplasmic intermediate filament protein B-like isoform X2 [Ruditapes philippinarum]|uniref:non-neuronal cytoplasmic intermediate filament protein B-like isoform X2 n=1 Tax=Ruditapes philippinarum TaxID=129788 RepID=UPI00295B8250|nr:non-neuronal cytoplasmic intermediate filament protein B-like isoform X2 [Ruditapes philippinarum]
MASEIRKEKKKMSMRKGDIVIQNTPRGSMGGVGTMTMSSTSRRSNVMGGGYGGGMMLPTGEASNLSKQAVQTVKGVRGKEKREMCDLNGRLASYLEKVKFLEATNKALSEECEKLRKIKGITGERIREEYEEELKECREALEEANKEVAPLQSKILSLEDKVESLVEENDGLRKNIEDLQGQIEKLNALLGEHEAETLTLRRQCESLAKERDNWKKEALGLRDDNNRLRSDLEAARTRQINAENERDRYMEECDFIKTTTDIEINELRDLLSKLQGIQPQIEQMWKSEFQSTLLDLQAHFDTQLEEMQNEQRMRYEDKLRMLEANSRRDNTDSVSSTEVKNLRSVINDLKRQLDDMRGENESLRRQLASLKAQHERDCEDCEKEKNDLRQKIMGLEAEIADISADLEDLQSSKLDLDLEIACYKKLMEGEENKIRRTLEDTQNMQSSGGASLSSIISKGVSGGGGQSSQSSNPVVSMSQSHGKVQVSRNSQCDIQIQECSQGGSYIVLANSSSKDFNLKDWTLVREFKKRGEDRKGSYKFSNLVLKPGKSVKVYSFNDRDDYEADKADKSINYEVCVGDEINCRTFGSGNGTARLLNPSGAQKASSTMTYLNN